VKFFKNLWAPWRKDYIGKKEKDCFICRKLKDNSEKDRENLILLRGKYSFVMLNLYPYNTGHLLIGPLRHVPDLRYVSEDEMLEIWRNSKKFVEIIEKEMKAEGFNLGFNFGKVAGAGVEGHMHLHVVPRWLGDTNFSPVISETKVISESIFSVYDRLKKYL